MHHSGSGLDDQLHLSVVEVDHVDQGEVGTEDPQVGQVFDRARFPYNTSDSATSSSPQD